MEGKEILDKYIIGRVDPYIYAFSTNTIPNYLKIGDTHRPVPERRVRADGDGGEIHLPEGQRGWRARLLRGEVRLLAP